MRDKTNIARSESSRVLRGFAVLCCALAIAMAGVLSAYAEPTTAGRAEIVRIKTRGDIEQSYLLMHEERPVKAVAVLFTGGFGLLKFRETASGIAWEEQGTSFLMINKDRFQDSETAVAVVDVPTDQWGFGYTPKFRKSDAHATDVRAVVKDLRARFPGARVYLIGTSQGSTSAAYAGKVLGKEVDGVILTASVFEWAPASWRLLYDPNLSDFDFAKISAPLLMVHHAEDRCVATPYSATAKFVGKYPLITVKGGEPVKDKGCGPMGPHGFLGREEAVVSEIKNWMHGRPYKTDIE